MERFSHDENIIPTSNEAEMLMTVDEMERAVGLKDDNWESRMQRVKARCSFDIAYYTMQKVGVTTAKIFNRYDFIIQSAEEELKAAETFPVTKNTYHKLMSRLQEDNRDQLRKQVVHMQVCYCNDFLKN